MNNRLKKTMAWVVLIGLLISTFGLAISNF